MVYCVLNLGHGPLVALTPTIGHAATSRTLTMRIAFRLRSYLSEKLPDSSPMKRLRMLLMLAGSIALAGAYFAAEPPAQAGAVQGQSAPDQAATPASQEPAKVCIDAQTDDNLIKAFADRLAEEISASGVLSLA